MRWAPSGFLSSKSETTIRCQNLEYPGLFKKEEILETLSENNFDICAFQETKRDKSEDEKLAYFLYRLFFRSGQSTPLTGLCNEEQPENGRSETRHRQDLNPLH